MINLEGLPTPSQPGSPISAIAIKIRLLIKLYCSKMAVAATSPSSCGSLYPRKGDANEINTGLNVPGTLG